MRIDRNIIPTAEELKLADKSVFETSTVAATPLSFAMATEDTRAMPHDVVRNGEGKIVIHIFRRPDIPEQLGAIVVKAALDRVIGRPPEGTDLLYRDEERIMKQEGLPRKVLQTDSWFIELPLVRSMLVPSVDYLRDQLALALQECYLANK